MSVSLVQVDGDSKSITHWNVNSLLLLGFYSSENRFYPSCYFLHVLTSIRFKIVTHRSRCDFFYLLELELAFEFEIRK